MGRKKSLKIGVVGDGNLLLSSLVGTMVIYVSDGLSRKHGFDVSSVLGFHFEDPREEGSELPSLSFVMSILGDWWDGYHDPSIFTGVGRTKEEALPEFDTWEKVKSVKDTTEEWNGLDLLIDATERIKIKGTEKLLEPELFMTFLISSHENKMLIISEIANELYQLMEPLFLEREEATESKQEEPSQGNPYLDLDLGLEGDCLVVEAVVKRGIVELFAGKEDTNFNRFLLSSLISGICSRLPEVAEIWREENE